jgi:UDP-N-acetylglucosamine 2-epimerase (non-hydrolysing)
VTRGRVAVVVGTRPEVIKLAPVVLALRQSHELAPLVISTGQHRTMLDQALEVFGIAPDLDLGLMAPGQTLEELTARALVKMKEALAAVSPSWVVVQGDTTTALAAAMAAFYARVPIAHVEAGLRSGDLSSPFPEEMNRRMVDQIADLLLAPTRAAADHLLGEGFAPERIHVTGNTVVDALALVRERIRLRPIAIPGLPEEKAAGKRIVLVTAHRRESFGAPLAEMLKALRQIARDNPDVLLVYPVHLNPNVDGPARAVLGGEERIALLPPLGYLEFVALLERSTLVLTDSGGVQEEAPTFGVPILVMRDNTERPEGVAAGVARLVGTSGANIVREASRLLGDPAAYRQMAAAVNPYGDGQAARRIVRLLEPQPKAARAA